MLLIKKKTKRSKLGLTLENTSAEAKGISLLKIGYGCLSVNFFLYNILTYLSTFSHNGEPDDLLSFSRSSKKQ